MTPASTLPGSEERIRQLQELVRRRRPTDSLPPAALPEGVGYRHVRARNGRHLGRVFFEDGAAGRHTLAAAPAPPVKPPRRRFPSERRKDADPAWRAAEALRKRQERLRRCLELAEVYLHPTGQIYLWEWRGGARRRPRPPHRERRDYRERDLFDLPPGGPHGGRRAAG